MSRRDEDGIWLETDYEQEGVLSLEFATEQLQQVSTDPYRWKWTIIGVHNSLQAFMVVACSGSDLLGAMTERYRKHWYSYYRRGTRLTQRPRLASFMKLFEQVQDLKRYVDTTSLVPTEDQLSAVKRLNGWRDDFVHYKPGSMSIEVSGFPDIIARSLEVIEFLAFRSMNVFRTADEWSRRTETSLTSSRTALAGIAKDYPIG